MADFEAVIRRAVGGLSDNSPEMRQKVYDKAREAIDRQLHAMDPRPSRDLIERQIDKLEKTIGLVEASHAGSEEIDLNDGALLGQRLDEILREQTPRTDFFRVINEQLTDWSEPKSRDPYWSAFQAAIDVHHTISAPVAEVAAVYKSIPEQRAGLTFEINANEKLQLARSGQPTLSDQEQLRELHPLLIEAADDLIAASDRSNAYSFLNKLASRYRRALGDSPDAV